MAVGKFLQTLRRLGFVDFDDPDDNRREEPPRRERRSDNRRYEKQTSNTGNARVHRSQRHDDYYNRPQERAVARRDTEISEMPDTMVYYMHTLNECSDVIRLLIKNASVLLNLEETDQQLMQRIVDTVSGAAFALGAKVRKVGERNYYIAPKSKVVHTANGVQRRY